MIPALFRSNFMKCATYSMEDLRLLKLNRKQSAHRFVIKCKIWKAWHFCLFFYTVSFFSLQVQCLCVCYFAAFLWILLASSFFYLALLTMVGFCGWTRKLTFLSVWVDCWKVSCIISGKYPQLLELLQFHPGISTPCYVMFGCALDFESIMLA